MNQKPFLHRLPLVISKFKTYMKLLNSLYNVHVPVPDLWILTSDAKQTSYSKCFPSIHYSIVHVDKLKYICPDKDHFKEDSLSLICMYVQSKQ